MKPPLCSVSVWTPTFFNFVGHLIDILQFEVGALGWEPQLTSDFVSGTKAAATVGPRFDGVILPTAVLNGTRRADTTLSKSAIQKNPKGRA